MVSALARVVAEARGRGPLAVEARAQVEAGAKVEAAVGARAVERVVEARAMGASRG